MLLTAAPPEASRNTSPPSQPLEPRGFERYDSRSQTCRHAIRRLLHSVLHPSRLPAWDPRPVRMALGRNGPLKSHPDPTTHASRSMLARSHWWPWPIEDSSLIAASDVCVHARRNRGPCLAFQPVARVKPRSACRMIWTLQLRERSPSELKKREAASRP